mmetsp:Transcript_20775/g.37835  ORF Transcript_20775/g.37835 Transcript_20775/m.37835 type:complete len:402 (+) Transcript_20775:133-1338(+)
MLERDAKPTGQGLTLGVDRVVVRCWEYSSLTVGTQEILPLVPPFRDEPPAEADEVKIVSASFGATSEGSDRTVDITDGVRQLLSQGYKLIPASVTAWGDPAPWTCKELAMTLDYMWLQGDDLKALEALQLRGIEKASEVEQEKLLARLAAALQGVINASGANGEPQPPLNSTSPRWKQCGFQSNDPRTDFRTGRLAIEALVYFAETYPMAATQMILEAQSTGIDYPFAVASINVTQLLLRYLGLLHEEKRGAPVSVVRRFARLLASSDVDVFGELHAAAVTRLHRAWQALRWADPQINIMSFGTAMDDTLNAVQTFLCNTPLLSASELRNLCHTDSVQATAQSTEPYGSLQAVALHADSALKSAAAAVSGGTGALRGFFSSVINSIPQQPQQSPTQSASEQ